MRFVSETCHITKTISRKIRKCQRKTPAMKSFAYDLKSKLFTGLNFSRAKDALGRLESWWRHNIQIISFSRLYQWEKSRYIINLVTLFVAFVDWNQKTSDFKIRTGTSKPVPDPIKKTSLTAGKSYRFPPLFYDIFVIRPNAIIFN